METKVDCACPWDARLPLPPASPSRLPPPPAPTEAVDAERRDVLERLEQCEVPQAQLYRLNTECRMRMEEVRELQKASSGPRRPPPPRPAIHWPIPRLASLQALSDAHTYLFEERERLLKLQADNDQLKLQEVEDRTRIKQLLALTRPVEQQVRYGQENGPQAAVIFPRGRSPSRRTGGTGASGSSSGADGERMLRTVYLPTAQAETLALKCEALQAQLAEQKRFGVERIQALVEDRALREREAASQAAATAQHMTELTERLKGVEEALRRTTMDYITARQQRDAAQAEVAVAQEQLRTQQAAATAQQEAAARQAADDMARLRQTVERSSSKAVGVSGPFAVALAAADCARQGCATLNAPWLRTPHCRSSGSSCRKRQMRCSSWKQCMA